MRIKLSMGKCLKCDSYYVELELPGVPVLEKHGLSQPAADAKLAEVAKWIEAMQQPGSNRAAALNAIFEAMEVPATAPAGFLGRPRFG